MINNGINNIPDKTIVVFRTKDSKERLPTIEDISDILKPAEKTRDWFTSNFYRCLPLTIGNLYGFTIQTQYPFSFEWDGTNGLDAITFEWYENKESLDLKYPLISSHFGSGVLTITPPFVLRTPVGVNLMTINPPNYVIPNITVMTGVVETDNLSRGFTFNLKIQIPNIKVVIPSGTPLVSVIPVPRYYCDKFELKFDEDLFSKEVIEEERQAYEDWIALREWSKTHSKNGVDRTYLLGKDVYGNSYLDHQTLNKE